MSKRVVSILLATLLGSASAQAYLVPGPGSGKPGYPSADNPPNYPPNGYYPPPPHNPGYNNGGVNLGPHPYPEYGPGHHHTPYYPPSYDPYYPPHNPPLYNPPPYNPPPAYDPYYPPSSPDYGYEENYDYSVEVPVSLGGSWKGTLELNRYVNLNQYRGMRLVAVEVDGEFTNYSSCSNGRWDLVLKVNGAFEGQNDFCGNPVAVIQASERIDGNERISLSVLSASRIYAIRLRISRY